MRLGAIVAGVSAVALARAASWNLKDTYSGEDYMNKFDYWTDKDPTNGLVTYQSEDAAKSLNLTYVDDNKNFVMRVDTETTRTEGRPSVRIQSQSNYEDAVIVLQVSHIPTGCAVWPAFWTVTANTLQWPTGGEIDIMENVNDQYPANLAAVHVQGDCSIDGSQQTGTTVFTNCNAEANDNSGCRIEMNNTDTATWGSNVNNKGGAVVAMQRDFSSDGKGIRMWFWDKSQNMPSDISKPGKTVNPDNWGTPAANFGKLSCSNNADGSSQFDAHKIVFDITLCGDWAGNAYDQVSQCPAKYQSCANQVGQAGQSFQDAYWSVGNLYVYESSAKSSASTVRISSAMVGVAAATTLAATMLAL